MAFDYTVINKHKTMKVMVTFYSLEKDLAFKPCGDDADEAIILLSRPDIEAQIKAVKAGPKKK